MSTLAGGDKRAGRASVVLPGSESRRQYAAFGILTLAVAGAATTLILSPDQVVEPYRGTIPGTPAGYFQSFLGSLSPLVAIVAVAAVGVVGLGYLQSRGWFAIYRPTSRGIAAATAIAVLFGILVVVAESAAVFRGSADINVPLPYALAFYPVAGYLVEILFKVLPLVVLLAALSPLTSRPGTAKWLTRTRLVWGCMVLVALLEPVFIVSGEPGPLSLGHVYVGAHVFAINVAQLYVFRRYDFVAMYSFRLVYYLIWHIGWGYLRLQLLF